MKWRPIEARDVAERCRRRAWQQAIAENRRDWPSVTPAGAATANASKRRPAAMQSGRASRGPACELYRGPGNQIIIDGIVVASR